MNNQFRVGDLALTTKDFDGLLLGYQQVELLERIPAGSLFEYDRTTYEAGCNAWWVTDDGVTPLYVPERYLMPLRGDFQPERQQSREVKA